MKPFRHLTIAATIASTLAAPAYAFDLVDALKAARQYDANYAAARADSRAGAEKAVQGRSQLLPSIGLSAGTSRTNPVEPASNPSYRSNSLGIQLTQPIFNVSSYTGYQKGQIASRISQLQLEASSQQLAIDVVKAYFDVLLAEDVLNVTRATKTAYERQLAQAKKAFEVGTATITDTHEAKAGFDGASAREIIAVSDLEIKRNALQQLTGLNIDEISRLKNTQAVIGDEVDPLADWVRRGEQNSLQVRISQQQLALAEQSLSEARGKHLPTVNLSAGYSQSSSNQAGRGMQDNSSRSIGLNLNLPLYAGGAISSQVTEAAANVDKAREQLEAARRQSTQNIRRAWLGVSNGAALVKAQEQLLISAKSKLDATRLGKDVGVRTNLDLLNAEKDYQDAIRGLAEARYNTLQARLALAQAAGLLDDKIVMAVNGVF